MMLVTRPEETDRGQTEAAPRGRQQAPRARADLRAHDSTQLAVEGTGAAPPDQPLRKSKRLGVREGLNNRGFGECLSSAERAWSTPGVRIRDYVSPGVRCDGRSERVPCPEAAAEAPVRSQSVA